MVACLVARQDVPVLSLLRHHAIFNKSDQSCQVLTSKGCDLVVNSIKTDCLCRTAIRRPGAALTEPPPLMDELSCTFYKGHMK